MKLESRWCLALEILPAILSILAYKAMRLWVISIHRLLIVLRPDEATSWRLLSRKMVGSKLGTLLVAAAAPRWNVHAIIATVGPLRCEESLEIDTKAMTESAAAWSVVLYAYPRKQSVAHLSSASSGQVNSASSGKDSSASSGKVNSASSGKVNSASSGKVNSASSGKVSSASSGKDSLYRARLKSGSYLIGLRYYGWTDAPILPSIKADGVEVVKAAPVTADTNDFYHDLRRQRNWMLFFLQFYVVTMLRASRCLPRKFVAGELLPVGNPDTTFYYGYLLEGEQVRVETASGGLEREDHHLAIYNSASLPVFWQTLEDSSFDSPALLRRGFFLLRVHPKTGTRSGRRSGLMPPSPLSVHPKTGTRNSDSSPPEAGDARVFVIRQGEPIRKATRWPAKVSLKVSSRSVLLLMAIFLKVSSRSVLLLMALFLKVSSRSVLLLMALFLLLNPKSGDADPSGADTALTNEAKMKKDSPMDASGETLEEVAAVLERSRASYAHLKDYTLLFIKQELISGKLRPEERIEVKFLKPGSVHMRWKAGPNAGRNVLYRKGKNGDKLLVREGGFLGILSLWLDPRGSLAMRNEHHPITEAGIASTSELVFGGFEAGLEKGDVQVKNLGEQRKFGRRVIGIEAVAPTAMVYRTYQVRKGDNLWKIAEAQGQDMYVILSQNDGVSAPDSVKAGQVLKIPAHYAQHTLAYLDADTCLLAGLEIYNWEGQLYERYEFRDLRVDVGLSEWNFDPENPRLGF